MLGLSTATLGWSRCLQRTQSLFFIFSFFPFFFFPPTKSFNRVWRRKENLKAIIFCWLFNAPLLQCCARDGDRAGAFVSPFVTSLWAGRGCAGALSSQTAPCFWHPKQERAGATCKDAGRAQGSWEGSCRAPSWQHLPQPVSDTLSLGRCSHVKLQVAPRAAGEGLGSLFMLPLLASVCPRRDVSIHMNQQQLCKYKPLESSICLCSHMGQPETATAREQNMRSGVTSSTLQALSVVCWTAGAGCSLFSGKKLKIPAQVPEDSFLFQFQLLYSAAEGNANLPGTAGPSLAVRDRGFPAGSSPGTHSTLLG